MSFELDTSIFLKKTIEITDAILNAAEAEMHEATDDLVRISSNIAPVDKDHLRTQHNKEVYREGNNIIGEVSYSAYEKDKKGRFNYALAMHEWMYKPSQPGTYEGYRVGRKYLERPLKKEAKKYTKWIGDGIKGAIE